MEQPVSYTAEVEKILRAYQEVLQSSGLLESMLMKMVVKPGGPEQDFNHMHSSMLRISWNSKKHTKLQDCHSC